MSSPQGSLRQRNVPSSSKKKNDVSADEPLDRVAKTRNKSTGPGSELEYKIALAIITVLAFVSRFWGISHPNEVVFDEVHFGKVSSLLYGPSIG